MTVRGVDVMRLMRFAAGGVLSSCLALSVTALLHEVLHVGESIAAGCGLGAALVVNFFFLRHVVFMGGKSPPTRQFLAFLASSGMFRGIEYLAFLVINGIFGVQYLIALVLVLGASFGLKFVFYDRVIFARRHARAMRGEPR